MSKRIITFTNRDFLKGISSSDSGVDGGFWNTDSIGFNLFSSDNRYGAIVPGPTKTDLSANIADTVRYFEFYDGNIYGFGDNGYLYKGVGTAAPTVLDAGNETNRDGTGSQGGKGLIIYNQGGTDYLFYAHGDDIGRYDLSSTFVDSYWKTTLGATALSTTEHKMIEFNGVLCISNGQYLASLDNTTADATALTLPSGYEIKDLAIYNNYIAILAIDTRGSVFNAKSKLYLWDGYTTNGWNYEYDIDDYCTALNNYKSDLVFFGNYVRLFNGGDYQVIDKVDGNFILPGGVYASDNTIYWQENNRLMAYGSPSAFIQPILQCLINGCGSSGAILPVLNGYSTIMISDNNDNYNYWNTGTGDMEIFSTYQIIPRSYIRSISFEFETLTTNKGVDVALYDRSGNLLFEGSITHTNDGGVEYKSFRNIKAKPVNAFQIYLSSSNYTASIIIHSITIEYEITDNTRL